MKQMNIQGNIVASRKRLLLPIFAIVLVACGVYANSLFNGFVLDDQIIIAGNPATRHLISIGEVLFSPDIVKPYYRPLNRASYLIDYQLFGLNPLWFHAVNIIIHALNAVLLYLVASRLLADRRAALFAALLFAVHPANSEAVNFISARNTLLALCFSLASFLTFLKASERGVHWPLFSAFLFFLGLLSKETAFMLIAIIAACTFTPSSWSGGKTLRDRLFSLVPYLVSVAVYLAMRSYSLKGVFGADVSGGDILKRLAMNYHIVPQYIGLLLFPADLTIFHAPNGNFINPSLLLPIWIALLAAIGLIIRRRNEAALFGLVWSAVNYIPISNIIQIPSDPITERFLYLPAVGFFIVLGALVEKLNSRAGKKRVVSVTVAVAVLACAVGTVVRNRDWKDDYALFASGVKNDPACAEAHVNLGAAFLLDKSDMEAARQEWETALSLAPDNSDALTQMGTYSAMKGDLLKAEQFYTAALSTPPGKSDPDKAMAHFNLGKIYDKLQRPEEALKQYELFLKYVSFRYVEYIPFAEQRVAYLRKAIPSISH